jgi:hypothetical protein
MVTPTTLMLAEVEQAERLRLAAHAHRVAEARATAPARRRWWLPFRLRRPAPCPAGPLGIPLPSAGAHPGGPTRKESPGA